MLKSMKSYEVNSAAVGCTLGHSISVDWSTLKMANIGRAYLQMSRAGGGDAADHALVAFPGRPR